MSHRRSLLCLLLVLLVLPSTTWAQDQDAMPPMGAPAELSRCDFLLGAWAVTMQYRMSPDEDWQTAEGTAVTEKILQGCALRQDFQSEVLGMAMKGMELLTYNRETKRYESMWIDDMGARMSFSSGNFEDGKLVMTGQEMQMGQSYLMRNTSELLEDGGVRFLMEMSPDEGATWFTSMRMEYTPAE